MLDLLAVEQRFTMANVRQMQDMKTGALIHAAAVMGVVAGGGAFALEQAAGRYADALGFAFQIADDLLDVVGQEAIAGKSLGTDLQHQKATLPIIHLWSCLDSQEQSELAQRLQQSRENGLPQLLLMLERYGSIEYARKRALEFSAQAGDCLEGLPENEATQMLQQLPGFVVDRVR